ncbi:MAG: septum formation protein Maf [Deltaproteobacteria bacterium]|nr:septum formation protein Maf [Deltaproteobacteria bacterium]
MAPLILASGSVVRRTLLERAGLRLRVEPAEIDEVLPPDAVAGDLAGVLGLAKARAVAAAHPAAIVIGADQVLLFRGRPLSKSATRGAARRRLCELSGRWHSFVSAAAVVSRRHEEVVAQQVRVRLRRLTSVAIDDYLDSGEWRGCVGCYQIENQGAHLVAAVDGDLNAVLGLPLYPLLQALARCGVRP